MATLSEICQQAAELAAAHGWPRDSIEDRTLFFVSEVGEVAEALLKLKWADASGNRDELDLKKHDLALELYDVIWNVCDLANILGLNLDEAAAEKNALNSQRRWGGEPDGAPGGGQGGL